MSMSGKAKYHPGMRLATMSVLLFSDTLRYANSYWLHHVSNLSVNRSINSILFNIIPRIFDAI